MERNKFFNRQNLNQFIKFTCFSISAGIIQVISFTLLNEIVKFTYWPSYLIALILSVLYNFTINRKFTFKSAANVPIAMIKVFCYYLVFTPLSTYGGHVLSIYGFNEYIILAITMIINFVTEFLFTKYLVFNDSNKNKIKED